MNFTNKHKLSYKRLYNVLKKHRNKKIILDDYYPTVNFVVLYMMKECNFFNFLGKKTRGRVIFNEKNNFSFETIEWGKNEYHKKDMPKDIADKIEKEIFRNTGYIDEYYQYLIRGQQCKQ